MPDYKLEVHHRFLDRRFESAIGKSLAKALSELITNSDDSYKRLAKSPGVIPTNQARKSITVRLFRAERRFQIIDQAEGLTDHDMLKRFRRYGEDTSGQSLRLPVRGLFGKGLADVMFTQQKSNVKSIKGDKSYVCKFMRKDGDPYLSINRGPRLSLIHI